MRFNSDQIQKIGKEISSKVDGKTLFDEFSLYFLYRLPHILVPKINHAVFS